MAGDWIKWSKGLARKREVVLIASALGHDRRYIAGALMELWEWVDENVTDLSRPERDTDDAVVELAADALHLLDVVVGVEGLAGAMVSVGWLKQRNGRLELPNFFRHNGSTAKDRALAALRKKRQRHGDVPKVSRPERDKNVTREQRTENREQRNKHPPAEECVSLDYAARPADGTEEDPGRTTPEPRRAPPTDAKPPPVDPVPERFERFWAAYPSKVKRRLAEVVFARVSPDEALLARMLAALAAQRKSDGWQAENGRYIPNPHNWLDNGQWEDQAAALEPSADPAESARRQKQSLDRVEAPAPPIRVPKPSPRPESAP